MQIHSNIEGLSFKNAVLTIGTFDGLHLGHKHVLDQLKRVAGQNKGESVILTFWPHPRTVISPDHSLKLLNTIEEKTSIFEKQNIDHLIILEFNNNLSSINYRDFVKQILVDKIGIKHLVLGYDHRFGRHGEGNFETVKPLAGQFGFRLHKLTEVFNTEHISSTRIRDLLSDGEVVQAANLLGYNYKLSGRVVKGQRLGSRIGFPTANMEPVHPHKLVPSTGVYAVYVKIQRNNVFKGMLNIGYRPTVGSFIDKSIEVHIIGYEGNLYNEVIEVSFEKKIREEIKFPSIEELVRQVKFDKETVIELLD